MKKIIPSFLLSALSVFSFNLKASDGLQLNNLPDKNHVSTFKLKKDDGDGIKGKIMITAGIGLNFEGTSLKARYLLSSNYDFSSYNMRANTMPMLNLGVDYGLGKKVSVGVAFGYQTIKLNFTDPSDPNSLSGWTDTWTRIHFAVRGDYYIVANENISLYTGAKIGYNMFTVKSTYPAPSNAEYLDLLDVHPNPVSVQAHFGFSYFVKGIVGFNAEFGLGYGGPYMLALGVTAKI
ncbi:MAG: hypothetical protein ACXVPU_00885 [Bacteroidia bacterium]